MKTAKRVLSIALALLLGVGLLVPGVSAAADPNAPVITKVPEFPASVRLGERFVVEIEAALPDGVNGIITYAWYLSGATLPNTLLGTGPRLEQQITPDIASATGYVRIRVVVTNTWIDGGIERSASVEHISENIARESHWLVTGIINVLSFLVFLPALAIIPFFILVMDPLTGLVLLSGWVEPVTYAINRVLFLFAR